MSFITKRERVFNEYDLFDLPARNEGKLKAYSSCTDARAWSHFCSDKSEHLVEIIKRNNDKCSAKYVPTEAIVNTLMVGKNTEIARLQRKIEEFEQMLAAYDELELTCDQKCEIAKAHAAIKDANKELDGILFNLDLSAFTDGGDSEAFQTGKSRGDEPSKFEEGETPTSKGDETSYFLSQWTFERTPEPPQNDSKGNQAGLSCACADAATIAVDPRIEDMQQVIITKDAKLNAMQNTIAVMENDVCEPYCIYAHIYTALEKIFGILCQNDKYKLYLDLMTSGKDTRCIDIKGKILFKLKVLEKFSLALIAPCSQDFATNSTQEQDCSCYRVEIVSRMETAYALTSAESKPPCLDNKRAQLVADIMENDEMKEILSKENTSLKNDLEVGDLGIDNYDIDSENLKRLKNLQENYDDLMTCYEALKHEKDCLLIRCRKYEELEKEYEGIKGQLREYSLLWNEKEHYRKRSANLDALKEEYLVLSEETSNIELQLKTESEINNVKAKTIDGLRRENIQLEQKLNDALILFEKEKNILQCKLKESECNAMLQDQQIKSLSSDLNRLLEQVPEKVQFSETDQVSLALRDEINSLNEQITNLKAVCICSDERKEQMQEQYQTDIINDLKMQIEELKNAFEEAMQQNDYLEKTTTRLDRENKLLKKDMEAKTIALENLGSVINNKSQEVDKLRDERDQQNRENEELYQTIQSLQETYVKNYIAVEDEKKQAIQNLQLARQESQELLEKVKDDLTTTFQLQEDEYKYLLTETQNKNSKLQKDLSIRASSHSILLQEIQKLREANQSTVISLEDEKNKFKYTVELNKKESKILQDKIQKFEDLENELQKLRDAHEKLLVEKNQLETELYNKTTELDEALHLIQLTKKESEELSSRLHDSENLKMDLTELNDAYTRIRIEQQALQNELTMTKNKYDDLLQSFDNLQSENEQISEEIKTLNHELVTIKRTYDKTLAEKNMLQRDFQDKTDEFNNLYNELENKIEDNKDLQQRLTSVENEHKTITGDINSLIEENNSTKENLAALRKESGELMEKVKYYETLESEYSKLKRDYEQMTAEKNKLERQLDQQVNDLRRIERENHDLSSQSQNLLSHSEDLEAALMNARTELIVKSSYRENPNAEIIKEIEEMKHEKLNQHKKIRDLLNKLDESENIISNLSEDVLARDDKIAILENHINQLEDEVRNLHMSLAEVIDTGEQITDHSSQKMNQSLITMEAHHSKANHNIKVELAKLQSVNTMLEERLSATKMRNEETARSINKLQNEREIIVTDIKQLELKSVGDSALCPEKCSINDVLGSLDRIRVYLDAKFSKSSSLEQTLLSVQNSYQLVQSKTDEAKKIVEKEKQKIINEKEEAIKDKINMEKQLQDLKRQLEHQKSLDKNIINDLEAEILNQKLIIDKMNKSTQSYIAKLKDDMGSLQSLYENSLKTINALENKIKICSNEKIRYEDIIEKTSKDLEAKIQEVEIMNETLAALQKEPGQNKSIQTTGIPITRNISSQTDDVMIYEETENSYFKEKLDNLHNDTDINPIEVNKPRDKKPFSNAKNKPVNEVQVLTANVDPTFDYVRSSYLDYKLKQLSTGRLEHYSISCPSDSIEMREELSTADKENPFTDISKPGNSSKVDVKTQNFKVIDIYNKKSMHTNSSKVIDNDDTENEADTKYVGINQIKSPNKSSAFTGFGLTNESFATVSNINNEYKDMNVFGSPSEVSTDKDMFVIYRDSESNNDESFEKKGPWNASGNSEIIVEAVTIQQNKNDQKYSKNQRPSKHSKTHEKVDSDRFINAEDEEFDEDDSVKHKLKISLPRVGNDSPPNEASDTEKKSLDSYTMAIYPTSKLYSSSDYNGDEHSHVEYHDYKSKTPSTHSITKTEPQYKDVTKGKREILWTANKNDDVTDKKKLTGPKPFRKNFNESGSHHRLSRVEADVLLIKSEEDRTELFDSNSAREQKSRDFGLDYILDSHKDPDNIKTYSAAKALRKTRSDERFNLNELLQRINDSSPSRLSELKKSSTDYKTISSCSKSSDKSHPKSYIERSIMVKLDTVEEYENKILHLTKTLENIEKDYKKKIDAIKMQYDNNIKSILNEHNQGVESIQNLHEETLQDILKIHENEVENLRTMSIEAMRKAEKLEKENKTLKTKLIDSSSCLDEEPIKISTPELKRRRRSRLDPKYLTKTNVEAFNVKPKSKSHGPCTCSLDVNISDTIRNIFEQVDVEQRKMAEYTYLKYIANKIMNGNVDTLDTQELSFLHLKVCHIWKTKLTKEESLQKRIDSLETELMNKQKHAQQNLAELDRKVAEERRRLQEVREAVCRSSPIPTESGYVPPVPPPTAEKDLVGCGCVNVRQELGERRSAGDLVPVPTGLRQKRTRNESNRAVLAKLDVEERREREKKIYTDELPTRLRKSHDRPLRLKK